jgi:altronate hydrolase
MTETDPIIIRLNPADNVAVALKVLSPGTPINVDQVICRDEIPHGHKVAVQEIEARAPIRKYGQIIGFATKNLEPGNHVHTHNVEILDFDRDYAIGEDTRPTVFVKKEKQATFEGFLREEGQVGTRNYIGVLSTVSCSVSVARLIADAFTPDIMAEFPNVDGVVSLGHGSGCGMGSEGEGLPLLQRALAGYARHPNFAGILLVGLGCEVNYIDCLIENTSLKKSPSLRVIEIQNSNGTKKTVEVGVEAVKEILPQANKFTRCTLPASHITLGLECGGSDAFSGISANPALGAAADLLVSHGGTAVLSETPEIYGAEHLLTRRAVSVEVGEKLARLIRWWEEYTTSQGGKINNNPSPGNKAGGLTTILEKSLGAASKGGTTNLVDVYGYSEPVSAKGFVFMDTPGYDVVSITGMIAGGANVICFTTGRGTVCGFKPVPAMKLASNTEMYQRLSDDMDINCGRIVDGDASVQEMGKAIFGMILETASGKKTKSEELGLGDNEFVPWQIGPVM